MTTIAAAPSLPDLTRDDCLRRLRSATVGRLAVVDRRPSTRGPRAAIVPVNFLVHEGAVFFRSGPGATMMDLTEHPLVAFEVDGHRGSRFWSVIVHGSAHRLAADADIEDSGVLQLEAFDPSDKNEFVRIDVESITGRSFVRRPAYRLRGLGRRIIARLPDARSVPTDR